MKEACMAIDAHAVELSCRRGAGRKTRHGGFCRNTGRRVVVGWSLVEQASLTDEIRCTADGIRAGEAGGDVLPASAKH